MNVSAYIIKTAQLNAAKENGKFSEKYESEATTCLIHPDGIKSWKLQEGGSIKCINHDNGKSVVLRIKSSTFVRKSCVNIMESPWTIDFFKPGSIIAEIEITPTDEIPKKLSDVIKHPTGGNS